MYFQFLFIILMYFQLLSLLNMYKVIITCYFSQRIQGHSNFTLFYLQIKLQGDISWGENHFHEISYPCYFCFLYCLILILGLIHANHGGEITDYLLNQLKDASTDVSFFFGS